jgi:CubicO group peptidase (beta-lactamase class C family)
VSMIVRHVSGVELQQFIGEKIAKPLGWGKWGFGYRRPEITHTPGGGGIEVRGPDIVRFGQMLLRGGENIVPREYVKLCSTASPYNPHYPYSLQFDVNAAGQVARAPRDAYWKTGSGGHCLYIVPSMKLVVWKLGGRDDQYGAPVSGPPFTAEPDNHRTIELVVDAIKSA